MTWLLPALTTVALAYEPVPSGDVQVLVTGFVDIGFFDAQGDGVAYDRDAGNLRMPDRALDAPWVFWGDPWSNPVNSQGDSADMGMDRTTLDREDRMASRGRPTLAVNGLTQRLIAKRDRVTVRTAIVVEPRNGDLGALGDAISLDTAYLDWEPLDDADLHVTLGKHESAFGIEYRNRWATRRHGVTPSLIARYTSGTPVGLKIRGSAARDAFWYALSVTNGNSFTERFGHFGDDIDSNGVPTVTARLAWHREAPARLELGASGQFGSVDGQPDPSVTGYMVGADARLELADFTLSAEFLRSEQGDEAIVGEWLDVTGGYVEAAVFVAPLFAPHVRVDRRVADLRSGPNLYVTDTLRITGGARFNFTPDLVGKVEYLHIRELGEDMELADDVFTSSVVFRF